jgi:hypothetical protein
MKFDSDLFWSGIHNTHAANPATHQPILAKKPRQIVRANSLEHSQSFWISD